VREPQAKVDERSAAAPEQVRALPETMAEYVWRTLRSQLLDGTYTAGSKLDQLALAAKLGVSVIPIREGLRQLEASGLVRISPNQGAFVVEYSQDDLNELYVIRELLEGFATRLAVPHVTSGRLRKLAQLLATMSRATQLSDAAVALTLNAQFHFEIYDSSESPLLVQTIRSLWDRCDIYLNLYTRRADSMQQSLRSHRAIYKGIAVGDAEAAAEAIALHIRDAAKMVDRYGAGETTALNGWSGERQAAAPESMKTRPRLAARTRTTKAMHLTGAIRSRILSGKYPLGSRIDQPALARDLGASLIPIRESLRQLEAEALVKIIPRRGAFVADISVPELTEIFRIREVLEPFAIRLAVPRLSPKDLAELDTLSGLLEKAAKRGEFITWTRLNRDWHFKLYRASESRLLCQLIEVMWDRCSLHRYMYPRRSSKRNASAREHRGILMACKSCDPNLAAERITAHIRRAGVEAVGAHTA
jgi:DNA-binding GntR family transcriptional regulator